MADKDCCLEELESVVHHLVRLLHVFERDQIEARSFSTAQYYVLLNIQRQPGISIRELSEKLFTATSTTSRVVDKLVQQGHIQRTTAPDDRRVVVLGLTDRGRQAITDLQKDVSQYYRDILEHIPSGEVENTLASARVLLRALEAANPNCC